MIKKILNMKKKNVEIGLILASWGKHETQFNKMGKITRDMDFNFVLQGKKREKEINSWFQNFFKSLWWCLFFWLFAENNLILEFRLFVFLFFS